jgi:SAM-dependent methyltransferase
MEAYERTSRTGLRCVENALVPVNKAPEDCKKILDFRCGYGRVLRALRARFPEAHITACDLNEDATKFCAETFGATPVQGYSDLSKTILPHKYDAIWVGSVFTHSIPDPFFNESWRAKARATLSRPSGMADMHCLRSALGRYRQVKSPKLLESVDEYL